MGKKKMKLSTKILISLGLGVIVGLILQQMNMVDFSVKVIQPFGDLFLRLIKMIIVPLVFSTLVIGAASVGDVKKLGRMGGKTIIYYLGTTAFAIGIGLLLANTIVPGAGLEIPVDAQYQAKEVPSVVQTLLEIIPTNPIEAMVKGNMLQIIAFALFVGVAINIAGPKAQHVFNFFDGFAEIMYKVTAFVMATAPIGVFGLIVPVVTQNGVDVLAPLAKVILAVYLGCLIHALLVYSLSAKFLAKVSPIRFFKGVAPASLIAFSTCSSSGSLPVSFKAAEENLGVSKEVSSFVLPLGATVNMNGTALYLGVCALFIAQVYGLDLSFSQQMTIVLTGTLASIGTAGVPSAGLIMLTMVLASVGLPMEGIALIAGVDRVLDMARTCINVTGDICGALVIARSENELSIK